jgi:E3 ubiquitin-protein ligase RNF115/126
MAQYLSALMGMRGGVDPLGAGNSGRWGDYAFTQDGEIIIHLSDTSFHYLIRLSITALDQIITQLMESNSTRPVPATEEMIDNLPREVLDAGCASFHFSIFALNLTIISAPTLEKECAVCKDQFQLNTTDPDEQVVVTLPCKHPFHENCIVPWLASSGTCPVCRQVLS